MSTAATDLPALTQERVKKITDWVHSLMTKHPDENEKYSPFMNPADLTIERLKREVSEKVDLAPEELAAWCVIKDKELGPVGSW